jgi:ADP-heptose:LPS heptosyltransferase
MATPLILAMRDLFPVCEFVVASDEWTRAIWDANPDVSGVVPTAGILGARTPSPGAFAGFVRRLRSGRFDAVCVLERSFWFALAPFLARIPVRIGLASGGRGTLHTHPVAVEPPRHESDLYFECARTVGYEGAAPHPVFVVTSAMQRVADEALRETGWRGERFVLIHVGGGVNPGMRLTTKRWPPARVAATIHWLAGQGIGAVLASGPVDGRVSGEILRGAPMARVLPATTPLSVFGGVALAADAYLGNDTGPSHIAAAVGTPSVIVFGPSDERRYCPRGRLADGSSAVEPIAVPMLSSDNPERSWPRRDTEAVSVEMVVAGLARALEKTPRRRRPGG